MSADILNSSQSRSSHYYLTAWNKKYLSKTTKRCSLRPVHASDVYVCVHQRAVRRICCCPLRTELFIVLKQDVIWKKIIAAWPHSFARLGGKKNIVPPSSSWNRDRFWRCPQGVSSQDSLLFPVLLFCSLMRVVLHDLQFLLCCPNPHKLLYLNSSVCFSLRWESLLNLLVWNTVNQNTEMEKLHAALYFRDKYQNPITFF